MFNTDGCPPPPPTHIPGSESESLRWSPECAYLAGPQVALTVLVLGPHLGEDCSGSLAWQEKGCRRKYWKGTEQEAGRSGFLARPVTSHALVLASPWL